MGPHWASLLAVFITKQRCASNNGIFCPIMHPSIFCPVLFSCVTTILSFLPSRDFATPHLAPERAGVLRAREAEAAVLSKLQLLDTYPCTHGARDHALEGWTRGFPKHPAANGTEQQGVSASPVRFFSALSQGCAWVVYVCRGVQG